MLKQQLLLPLLLLLLLLECVLILLGTARPTVDSLWPGRTMPVMKWTVMIRRLHRVSAATDAAVATAVLVLVVMVVMLMARIGSCCADVCRWRVASRTGLNTSTESIDSDGTA